MSDSKTSSRASLSMSDFKTSGRASLSTGDSKTSGRASLQRLQFFITFSHPYKKRGSSIYPPPVKYLYFNILHICRYLCGYFLKRILYLWIKNTFVKICHHSFM